MLKAEGRAKTASPLNSRPFVVVLTGGIASGKSVVSALFQQHDVPIIDTDVIARQLVEPPSLARNEIKDVFGSSFFDRDGRLERRKMREEIVRNPIAKQKLENILHPLIQKEVEEQLKKVSSPYCIVVVPLFFETRRLWKFDRVLVVDTDERNQIRRLMARDQVDEQTAYDVLRAQSSREQRLQLADKVIINDNKIEHLSSVVSRLHHEFLQLAKKDRLIERSFESK